jgi:hypothetical protein
MMKRVSVMQLESKASPVADISAARDKETRKQLNFGHHHHHHHRRRCDKIETGARNKRRNW